MLFVGQPLHAQQGADHRQQRQAHRRWPLVEQKGGKRREQCKAEQAARIAQGAQFAGLDRQHGGEHRAAGIAAEAHADLPVHRCQHRDHQQQPHRRHQGAAPAQHADQHGGHGNGGGKQAGQLQQQRRQRQPTGGQHPGAAGLADRKRGLSHAEAGPGRADTGDGAKALARDPAAAGPAAAADSGSRRVRPG